MLHFVISVLLGLWALANVSLHIPIYFDNNVEYDFRFQIGCSTIANIVAIFLFLI